MKTNSTLLIILFAFLTANLYAQGDGPRVHLPAPVGAWGVLGKYMNMQQNLLPTGNLLVKEADFDINVFPTTLFHTFGLKGREAMVQFMINPGSATGTFKTKIPSMPVIEESASGLSDGFVCFRLGLVGAPALDLNQFYQAPMTYNLHGFIRVWYSGTYDKAESANMGTNRTTIELGAPMAIPLNKNPKRATWFEIYPSVQFFTVNNDPVTSSGADKLEQAPLFLLENHLSHNLTPKLWVGADLRYQYGGLTTTDGVEDDNLINILATGVTAGYKVFPFLDVNATYGGIVAGQNNAESRMFRITALLSYVNLKKLNQTTTK
jgi:hypothetical protein